MELDTAEGFILHYEGTVEHLRTHISTGKLNPLHQQHNTTTPWNSLYPRELLMCVVLFVCVWGGVCMFYRGKGKVMYLDEGEGMEAILQSRQNEQCYLCVSIYVEFPHWAFLTLPAHWSPSLSCLVSQREGETDIYILASLSRVST